MWNNQIQKHSCLSAADSGDVVSGLESGQRYDVVVLAATRSGFPAIREADWLWVSHRVDGSETTPGCNAVTV